MSGAKKASRIKKSSTSEAGAVKQSSSGFMPNVLTVAKIGGAVIAVFLALTFYKKSSIAIQDLSNASEDVLKDVFFGDLPYLFYCAKGESDKAPSAFVELNNAKSNVGFAKVNCTQKLASGRTISQRFKVKKEVRPTVFATAPWIKPQQVPANHLKDAATLTRFIDNVMAPKPTPVFSDKDMRKFCAFGGKNAVHDTRETTPTCLVLLKGAKYTKVHADLEKRLVQQFPKVKIASVDAKKKRLSFEETGDYLSHEHFALKIHALRNGTHFMSMVNPITWDYVNTFVSQAVDTPLYGFSTDAPLPVSLNKVKTAQQIQDAKDKRLARAKPKAKVEPPTGTTASAATEVSPEVAEAERIRKERLRREQMERQAQEHLFSEADDEDSGSEEADGAGEDEDEQDDEEEEEEGVIEI